MKKRNLLIAAASAIVIFGSAYAGITVMADDSVGSSPTETTQAKDEVILSVEDLTEQNLSGSSSYNGYGIYTNADKSAYTLVTDNGNKVSTINNSDGNIAAVSFATGCYTNNAVAVRRTDGTSTILNLDGSYYGKLTGSEASVTLEADGYVNKGGYIVNDGQNFTFYEKDGSELFKIEGTGTIMWQRINGYNVFSGVVNGVLYRGAYDNKLNKVYDSISIIDDGYYRADNGTDTIFFDKDGNELFRIPYTGKTAYISWSIFNGYNALSVKESISPTAELKYLGLYDNKLNLVIPTPEGATSVYVQEGLLKYYSNSLSSSNKTYYFNSDLKACEKPATLSDQYKLDDSYHAFKLITIDGIKFIVGSKNVNENGRYIYYQGLFDTSGKLVYNDFADIYPNGLCTIKDKVTGKLKLAQLSVKTLANASKDAIDLGSDNVMTGDISVAVNAGSADTTVTEPLKIHIESPANVIPQGASLCAGILKAGDGERFVLAQNAVSNTTTKFTVFDIDLLSAGNIKLQPDGNVKIALGIPATYSTSSLKVYRIETDGTKTDMNAVVVGGTIVFETNHFSVYVLSDESSVANAPITNNTSLVPDTSTNTGANAIVNSSSNAPATMDNSRAMIYFFISIVATGCLAITLLFNKKRIIEE